MNKDDFMATFGPLANDVASETGLHPSVVLGQLAQETGYGAHVSGNGTNPWGISPGGKPTVYPDIQSGARAYVNLIKSQRYAHASQQGSPDAQAHALGAAGYGPDQGYGAQIAARANTVRQAGFNAPTDNDIASAMAGIASPGAGASPSAGMSAGSPAPKGQTAAAHGPSDDDIAKAMGSVSSQLSTPTPAAVTAPPTASSANPAPTTPTAPQPPVDTPQEAPNGLAKNAAAGVLGAAGEVGNIAANPVGNLIGKPVATGIVFAHDALAPYLGYKRFPDDVRNMLLGDTQPQPGTAAITAVGKAIGANPEDVPVNTKADQLVRSGVPNALLGAPFGPVGAVAGVVGGLAGQAAAPYVPPWAQPMTELGANLLAGGAAAHVGSKIGATGSSIGQQMADWAAKHAASDYVPPAKPAAPEPNYVGGLKPVVGDLPSASRPVGPAETNPNLLAGTPPAGAPAPKSAGAAATPPAAITPSMSPGDLRRAEQSQLNQTASDRATSGGNDTAEYVPGYVRTPAAREFSNPMLAADEKATAATDPAFKAELSKIQANNNNVLIDHYHDTVGAGDPKILENLKEASSAATKDALDNAFQTKTAVPTGDVQSVVDSIDKILGGPAGKRSAVSPALNDVRSKLFDKAGNLETDPEVLYGVRQNITDKLSSSGQADPNNRLAKAMLGNIKEALDPVITAGAPQFPAYLKAVADSSRPADAMSYLQSYLTGPSKLTDANGAMQYARVQRMIDNTVRQRASPGFTAANSGAKALTPEQMQGLFDMRNELAADHHKDTLARTKGSDSLQQFSAAGRMGSGPVGSMIKAVGNVGMHLGVNALAGPIGNAAYAAIRESRRARAVVKQGAAMDAAKKAYMTKLLPPATGYPAARP